MLGLCLALLLGVALLLGSPWASALAQPDNPINEGRLDSTVRYLQDVQLPDGGFANAGDEPSQDFSAWVAFALAAAGINPRDQAQPGGVDAYSFLVAHFDQGIKEEICAPVVCTTTFERELLVVDTAGTSPYDFAGVDLVGEILARALPGGSFALVPGGRGEVNDTVYAILALSLIKEPAAQTAVQSAAKWLISEQNADHGWSWQDKRDPSEVDMTGAAIEALNAAGMHGTEAQQQAFEYLHQAQEPDGGFPEFPGEGEANVASTAWATQGIWSAGENPETWVTHSGEQTEEPLGYLASLQQPDGHIKWRENQEMNGVWMTAMVAPTFAGGYFPYPEVPYVGLPPSGSPGGQSSSTPPSAGSAEPGQGGESSQPGSGVIAGGGGNGAPLFSRPQPASKGKTPGGQRQLRSTHAQSIHERAAAYRRNPGVRRSPAAAGRSGSAGARALSRPDGGSHQPGEEEVKGVLIAARADTRGQNPNGRGAPGLHSAGAGGNRTPWLAIGIAGALVLCFLLGTQLERRRAQVIL